jgi:hypothetical protein
MSLPKLRAVWTVTAHTQQLSSKLEIPWEQKMVNSNSLNVLNMARELPERRQQILKKEATQGLVKSLRKT